MPCTGSGSPASRPVSRVPVFVMETPTSSSRFSDGHSRIFGPTTAMSSAPTRIPRVGTSVRDGGRQTKTGQAASRLTAALTEPLAELALAQIETARL